VCAELPGVRKEDINVTIDGDEIAISAQMKRESESKGKSGTALHTERFSGRMYRAFTLGHEIDQAKAQAKYVDGVLELTLPKLASEQSKRKQIPIH
jgi:HSP20 family protein